MCIFLSLSSSLSLSLFLFSSLSPSPFSSPSLPYLPQLSPLGVCVRACVRASQGIRQKPCKIYRCFVRFYRACLPKTTKLEHPHLLNHAFFRTFRLREALPEFAAYIMTLSICRLIYNRETGRWNALNSTPERVRIAVHCPP